MNIQTLIATSLSLLAGLYSFPHIHQKYLELSTPSIDRFAPRQAETTPDNSNPSKPETSPISLAIDKKHPKERPFRPKFDRTKLLSHWPQAQLNAKTYENMADIDAILHMEVPSPDAEDEHFLQFAESLNNIRMGRRYSNSGITTPLLPWYVYIAKYSPDAIYTMANQRHLDRRLFTHLISFGYLPNWYQKVNFADSLIVNSEKALLALAMNYGSNFAKQAYIDALFSETTDSGTLQVRPRNLLFALSEMDQNKKTTLTHLLLSNQLKIDPRSVMTLFRNKDFELSQADALLIIEANKMDESRSRMMSPYFVDAAGLGSKTYFTKLLTDVDDNDNQPNHFYCGACGVALYGEGLIGSELIRAVSSPGHVQISQFKNGFLVERSL